MAATEAVTKIEIAEAEPSANGWFQIAISGDGSTVSIKKIVRQAGAGKPVDTADILKKLKSEKVIHGIDLNAINNLLALVETNQIPAEPVVIASSNVEEGRDGSLQWCIEGIDALGSEIVVAPDMQIAVLKAAIKGKPGKNVLGKVKQPQPVFIPQLNAGTGINVEAVAAGEFIYKTDYAGELKYVDNVIFIERHITIADDHMQAHMHIPAGKVAGAGQAISEQDIRAVIASMNITDGILADNIQSALKKNGDLPGLVKDVLVAQGKKSRDGVNARLVVDEHFSVGKVLNNGEINFHEMSYPWNVETGEVIGHVIPAQREEDGFTVLGKILSAIPAEGANLVLEGLEEETDGQLRAIEDGILLVNGLNFSIVDHLDIKGDVCHRTGNIHSDKAVIIRGYIEPGFIVESKGDIIVQENVEQSLVRSNGCIVVKSGIRGSQSKIISRGNISTSFAENARLKALGDITVENSIVNCYSYCQGTLYIGKSNSKKSTLIGGTTHAIKGIVAANLGSEGCNKIIVRVGSKPETLHRLKKIDEEMTDMEQMLNELQLVNAKHRPNPASVNDAVLEKINMTYQAKKHELEQLQHEQQKLLALIQSAKKATVVIHQHVYPGVCIQILDKSHEVRKKENAGVFFLEDDLIIFRPAA